MNRKLQLQVKQLLFAVLFLCSASAWAQTPIKGTVHAASDDLPLPGVSVIIKPANTGSATDADGNFSLTATKGDNIHFMSVGFKEKIIIFDGVKTEYNILLEDDSQALGEVVVTALGIKREAKKLGYALTEVKGEALAEANPVNPLSALQGKVAGVNINIGAGGPQASARINIRGNTSLKGNNQPIIVIDGSIIENSATDGGAYGITDFGNEMKNLNPDDFESVSVLKGAAGTALYGSRGANGVIVITTKKGKARKGLGINFTNSTSFEHAYKGYDFQNEYGSGTLGDFKKGPNGMNQVDLFTDPAKNWGPKFDGSQVLDVDGSQTTWSAQPNNMLDAFQVGGNMNTSISVDGGNEKSTFRLGYSNLNAKGIIANNKFSRNNFTLRATQQINDFLDADVSATYTTSNSENPIQQGNNNSAMFAYLYDFPRNYRTGYWSQSDQYKDPQGGALRNVYNSKYWYRLNEDNNEQKENNFRSSILLKAKLNEWLNFSVQGNVNRMNSTGEFQQMGVDAGYGGAEFRVIPSSTYQYSVQPMLSGSRSLTKDLDLGITLGAEHWKSRRNYVEVKSSGGLRIPGQFTISNSLNAPETSGGISAPRQIDAVFGSANFAYKSMLFLELTGRNDWSSTLLYPDGTGNFSYFYPGANASWVFTEGLELPAFFSFGKLRASWAQVGKDTDPFLTGEGFYKFNKYNVLADGTTLPYYTFDSDTKPNYSLKPELSRSIETGLDLRFFKDRLGLDFAYYRTNTFNQIMKSPLPIESGYTDEWINAGNIQNEGVELLLTGTPIKNQNFSWTTSLTYTRNRNKIISLAEGVKSFALNYGQGEDFRTVAIPGSDYGIIETKYAFARDGNGNKMLDGAGHYMRSDAFGQGYVAVGNIQPDFLGSITNSFRYKDFSLSFMLDAKIGGDMVSASYNYGLAGGALKETLAGRDQASGGLERVTYKVDEGGAIVYNSTTGKPEIARVFNDGMIPEGTFAPGAKVTVYADGKSSEVNVEGMTYKEAYDQGLVQAISTEEYYTFRNSWGTGIRETAVFKSSWIMLRDLSIGYSFPQKMVNKWGLGSLRLNLTGRNLFYLYNTAPGGINPESTYGNQSGSVYEYGGMPFTRTFGFSINVGL